MPIARISEILHGVCDAVREAGASPFLVASMGSHGGGTGPGQRSMLEHLGITEASVGAPIESEMDVVDIARTEHGVEVVCDARAALADAIVVVARAGSGPVRYSWSQASRSSWHLRGCPR